MRAFLELGSVAGSVSRVSGGREARDGEITYQSYDLGESPKGEEHSEYHIEEVISSDYWAGAIMFLMWE